MYTPITGIVAEYNPLHRGHLHHLKKARELSDAEAVVVVLSSDFVQRGEPALLNKRSRTEAALDSGADLVMELPLVFSAHNAGVFANAAVDILGSTGIVTHLSFGLESPGWQMDEIADILTEEPEPFKFCLKEYLKKGYSFVEARSLALDEMIPGSAEKLRGSNNNLALAYIVRIHQKKWNMVPVHVQRLGAKYHNEDIAEYSSATAVRKALAEGRIEEALAQLPPASSAIVKSAVSEGQICVGNGKLWDMLRPMLLKATPEEISRCAEIGEGIEYRLREAALRCTSFEEWSSVCSSRRYPRGRIQRHGIHFLLGLEHWTNRAFQRIGPAYIRVLGMNDIGRKLLRRMRTKATLPVITRCGAAASISEYAGKMMDYECLGAELWQQMIPSGVYGKEHTRKIIIRKT
ncbi:MAG: nucleotidyltransferase family protein [Synergistaceae bacterium]|nr:nucleotidyltransferase family protein [Synergistaceae bacterium]